MYGGVPGSKLTIFPGTLKGGTHGLVSLFNYYQELMSSAKHKREPRYSKRGHTWFGLTV